MEEKKAKKYERLMLAIQMTIGFIEGSVAVMAGVCCLMAGGFLGYFSGILLCLLGMGSLYVVFHPNGKDILTNQTANIMQNGTYSDYIETTYRMIAESKKENKE